MEPEPVVPSDVAEPFPRPVPVVGILSLAGEEVETVSMEVIQMWTLHLRSRLGERKAPGTDPALA